MKNPFILFLSISLFLQLVSATQVWIDGANVTVNSFIEKIEITGKDGYFKDVGYLSISNSELNKSIRIVILPPFLEGFTKNINKYNFSACSAETRYSGGNYFRDYNWGLECRRNIINMNVDTSPTDHLVFDINLSRMEWGENELKDETKGVYFQFIYMLKDFVISNEGNYNFLWIKGLDNYYQSSIELNNPSTILVLPSKDTILESLGAFRPYEFDENKRMILVYSNSISDNFLAYRDAEQEKKFALTWEYSLILISLGFVMIFSILQLYLHKDKFLNNIGWVLMGSGCLGVGFGGLTYKSSLIFWGTLIFLIGTLMMILTQGKNISKKKIKEKELKNLRRKGR